MSSSNATVVEDCIFCNISNKTINADIVFENDKIIVIRDILPKAPVHLLVIPKQHIPSANELTEAYLPLMGDLIMTARNQAQQQGVADGGYKLIFNVGKNGGQTVNHLHLHLLGGKQLA